GLCENFHHRKTSTSIRVATRRVLESPFYTLVYDEPCKVAYPGIAPVRRWLETTIRGEFSSRPGRKRLKNALPHSAWAAACGHALSKTYLERKRTAGEGQNAKV